MKGKQNQSKKQQKTSPSVGSEQKKNESPKKKSPEQKYQPVDKKCENVFKDKQHKKEEILVPETKPKNEKTTKTNSVKKATFKDRYVLGYNILQFVMWSFVLASFVVGLAIPTEMPKAFVYRLYDTINNITPIVNLCHLFMLIELFNSLLGIVHSKFFTLTIQIASRILATSYVIPFLVSKISYYGFEGLKNKNGRILTFKEFVKNAQTDFDSPMFKKVEFLYAPKIPDFIRNSDIPGKMPFDIYKSYSFTVSLPQFNISYALISISICIIAWSIAEMCKYNYFIRKILKSAWNKRVGVLFNKTDAEGICYFTSWLRYSSFIILYPIGVYLGEIPSLYISMIYSSSPGYRLFCLITLLTYIPGLFIMYIHMLKQRRAWKNKNSCQQQ